MEEWINEINNEIMDERKNKWKCKFEYNRKWIQ